MGEIPLRNKLGEVIAVALVDDSDLPGLNRNRWYRSAKGYAARGSRHVPDMAPGTVTIWMHRQILKALPGLEVDHINGDKLDNRRCNLRLATPSENRHNARGRANASGCKGVHLIRKTGLWEARITAFGKRHYLGHFRSMEEARDAYNAASLKYQGNYAYAAREAIAAT